MELKGGVGHLTRREREIALLAAQGMTNRQAAFELGISERTVDGSIAVILRKLGLTSRTQLGTSLARSGVVGNSGASRLPAPLSSFVGREPEIASIVKLSPTHRLITLVGPGGVGKTRLAIELGRMLEPRFAFGADFVALSGVSEPELVDEAVLAGLGLRADGQRPARAIVSSHLRDEHRLLLLDNCEHVIDASAELLADLLADCRQLHILATSREPLMVIGERVCHVAPLELPIAGQALGEDVLWRHSALRLFVQRSEDGGAAFPIRRRDIQTVVEICRRLDGLPLALELAAARMRVMSPDMLLSQLSSHERFSILTSGPRTEEDRHRTLRATVEWSYRLLMDRERLLFARLSVFAGPFDLAAATQIGGSAPIAGSQVMELLAGLVDKSLVSVVAGRAGSCPYLMLDTLRAFGRERLTECGEQEVAQRRHAHHYAELLAKPALTWTRAALDEVRDQLDDVRTALAWCCANEPGQATLICGRLVGFWGRQGHIGEGCQWMERIIDSLPQDNAHRAVAYANASWLAQRHGDFELAERYAREELRIARVIGDVPAVADSLTRLGDIARNSGSLEAAVCYGEEGVAIRRREDDAYELALALVVLGSASGRAGAFAAGRLHLQEAIRLFERIGEPSGIALCQGWLGELELRAGDVGRARELLTASLRTFRDFQDAWMVANILDLLSWLAGIENEPVRALNLAGAAAGVRERIGGAALPALTAPLAPILVQARRWLRSRAEAAWRQGADAEIDEVLRYALRDAVWEAPEKAGAAANAGGLTPRELEVALLVTRGLADKEIAARLGISVRTAEYHVEQIRRKLACASRTQVAAWVLEHGLKPTER